MRGQQRLFRVGRLAKLGSLRGVAAFELGRPPFVLDIGWRLADLSGGRGAAGRVHNLVKRRNARSCHVSRISASCSRGPTRILPVGGRDAPHAEPGRSGAPEVLVVNSSAVGVD